MGQRQMGFTQGQRKLQKQKSANTQSTCVCQGYRRLCRRTAQHLQQSFDGLTQYSCPICSLLACALPRLEYRTASMGAAGRCVCCHAPRESALPLYWCFVVYLDFIVRRNKSLVNYLPIVPRHMIIFEYSLSARSMNNCDLNTANGRRGWRQRGAGSTRWGGSGRASSRRPGPTHRPWRGGRPGY